MVLTISQFLTQIGLDENYKFFILSDSVSIFIYNEVFACESEMNVWAWRIVLMGTGLV